MNEKHFNLDGPNGFKNEADSIKEKEEKWFKCLPFKPSQWKKALIFFVAINIVIFWFFYHKSSNISYFYYQSKTAVAKPAPLPIYNVSLFHIPLLTANDMVPFYSEVKSKTWCFLNGIDPIESKKRRKCVCIDHWFGLDCGIPAAVWKSDFLQEGKNANIEIRRRDKPRRVISSFVVGGHQDVLDINIYNTFSIIDLYLTVEGSNQKPSIMNMFKNGHLAEWLSKIIPFQLKRNVTNKVDTGQTLLMLKGLWDIAWKRLTDFRPDDLFIFSHASSIISKDVLLFLKLYDGFSEPFFFELRPVLFKFWRQMKSNNTNVKLVPFKPVGCSFQFLASMCNFEVSWLFTNSCNGMNKKIFEKNNWPLKEWVIGSGNAPSGWQCNLCCKNKCIEAHPGEFKGHNISTGNREANSTTVKLFLDNINMFNSKDVTFETVPDSDPFFAPKVVLNKNKKFAYLFDSTEYI